MKFNKKLIATSIFTASFLSGGGALAGDMSDEKRTAERYWNEFKQDSKQTWSSTESAFRDGWVEGKLESALIMNEHLDPFDIGIDVDKDTAKLTGEVSTSVEKELAESVALGIEGIDRVDNQIQVNREYKLEDRASSKRSLSQYMEDVNTSAAIKTKLLRSSNVNGLGIDVDVYSDEVVLRGEVESEAEKDLAENIAKQVAGVDTVQNKLKIDS